jgi:hypothetical protein
MKNERRLNERHRVVDDAYAALGRHYAKVGKIVNISIGGLAFDYITGDSELNKAEILDIFLSNNHFNLYNLRCKVVYDMVLHVPEVSGRYTVLLTTRRCGVRFGKLSNAKTRKLQAFVDSQPENG